ncbi:DotA/TraY family protein [Sulfurivirga sp.]|uniref:DotA/TraY family protein n=1 Tax=Sulfurivirga sp. TaxID=2614236 RepID=UPI0025ED83BF|nr:DotA/TraY family protein [Sulfurivirga sp.]
MIGLFIALVAGPLWAVAHALPESEGGFFGRWSLQGYQLLLGVMLRPMFMVIALFGAMILAKLGMDVVLLVFGIASDGALITGSSWSILGGLVMVVIFTLIVITVMNKTHELIYLLPDRVLQWIGVSGMSLGEDAVAGRVEGGAGQIKSGAHTAVTAGVSAMRKAGVKNSQQNNSSHEPNPSHQTEGGETPSERGN